MQNGTMNSATAVQGGSSLTATISQVGTGATDVASNTGITNQSGTGHTATINQNGTAAPNGSTFNRAYLTQKNGATGPGANSATVSQSNGSGGAAARGGARSIVTGDVGNFAGTFQVGSSNTATLTQDGPGSKANLGEITQQGTGNTATTTQSNGAVSNLSQIFQGYDLTDVSSNTATVNQDAGQRNEALVKQFSNGNKATVTQTGINSTDNKAFVTQGDGSDPTGQANNLAKIEQLGLSTGNSATVIQTGKNTNNAGVEIYQSNNSTDNIAFVHQISGEGSNSRIYQTNGSNLNNAKVIQYGNYHEAVIDQAGYAGTVSNNFSEINQGISTSASDHNRTFTHQTTGATSSTITVNQNTLVGGQFNDALVEQIGGTLNQALVNQQGSHNAAGLVQTGAGSNTATIGQTGDYNVVKGVGVYMAPDYPSLSSALQNGSGNSMTVTQTSTGATTSASLNNTAMLSQIGTNVLTVSQTINVGAIAGNLATANQTGMNNQAIVQQTAMP